MASANLKFFKLLLASLVLHSLFGFLISVYSPAKIVPEKPSATAIEITLDSAPISAIKAKEASKLNSERKFRDIFSGGFQKGSLVKALSNIQANVHGSIPIFNSESEIVRGNDQANHGWSSAVQFGNEMDVQKTFATIPFYLALHTKIDSLLVYPDDFSRQRLTGRVRIEAELDRDGRLLKFKSAIDGESSFAQSVLQTYCLAFLVQALRSPLPRHAWTDSSQVVAFEFDFHTHIPGQPQLDFPTVIHKNRLAFGRDNEIDPWLNERINEIFTHYLPPIVPLPGGVYVDFVLAYQFVQNLVEGAKTERALRQERIESLHLNLQQILKPGT